MIRLLTLITALDTIICGYSKYAMRPQGQSINTSHENSFVGAANAATSLDFQRFAF